MSSQSTAILWFRQDLRLNDNTALLHAAQNYSSILPVFILDDENAGEWKRGGASRWWLHNSLKALGEKTNGNLVFRKGRAEDILPELIKESGASAVYWNRCYEPWRISRDKTIKEQLQDLGIDVQSFKDSMLWEPWEVLKSDGTPYKVFTPYYRKGCLQGKAPREPEGLPEKLRYQDFSIKGSLDELGLMPRIGWYHTMAEVWQPGEDGAQARLKTFLEEGLKGYKEERNRPDMEKVSRLSPHLHFGEISPREVWYAAQAKGTEARLESDTDHFCSELGWREFSTYLLYHFPEMTRKPLQEKYQAFPWDKPTDETLMAWQKGQTGIPIVDAGMRQLWQTGWMHNRVRMIVASLLVKNMLIHWHHGEDWFWDCLVDADLANNSASWQWVAGCGADAAPYFRIFNPVTQGQKFDPDGAYVREFVPELRNLPDKYVHSPWEAPENVLAQAGLELGNGYPKPIVDLKKSRQKALDAFAEIKKAA